MKKGVFWGGLAMGLPLLLMACAGPVPVDSTPTEAPLLGEEGFTKTAFLTHVGEDIILPTLESFSEEAALLEEKSAAYALALELGEGDQSDRLLDAQDQWVNAMVQWEVAELLQVGPAASSLTMIAGEDLRDEIYSWPTVNACRVDQEIVNANYLSSTFFSENLVNVYGLDTLEYLLFHTGRTNHCASQATINAAGEWAALSDEELALRRAQYAAAVAGELSRQAEVLAQRWSPQGDNFLAAFAQAGQGDSPYADADEAIDQLFAAIFYLDSEVKDYKMGEPAGLNERCSSEICPDAVESLWAYRSRDHVLHNLTAFSLVFGGGDGDDTSPAFGFEDYLIAVGAPELAERMANNTDAALAEVEAIPGTLHDAVANDKDAVASAYQAIKAITDDLKNEFAEVLDLEIPADGAGDND